MKHLIILIFCCIATLTQAQSPVYFADAAIDTNTEIYDFGEIEQTDRGEFIYCDFEVKNIGNAPLIISKCKGSCGCTTPKCDTTPILAKKSTKVKVRYDSNRVGPFTKTVTIYSNASNESEKVLKITGTVIAK